MSQDIRSWYYPRQSLRGLWRQYYQYGYWRFRTVQKQGKAMALRQLVPALFVLSVIVTGIGGFLWCPIWWLLAAAGGLYVAGTLGATVLTARRAGWKHVCRFPVIFAVLHWAYGLGFLKGMIDFGLFRCHRWGKRMADMKISR